MMRVRGFSLVELVIVVGIIAVIAIPRMSQAGTGANEAALRANLAAVRTVIDMDAAEHGGTFPGAVSDGTNAAGTAKCFRWQLWYFSNADGVISQDEQTGYPFGPYIRKLPKVQFGPAADKISVAMVGNGVPLSGDPDPINPWKYDYTTGEFIFNWDALSSDGVTKYDDF